MRSHHVTFSHKRSEVSAEWGHKLNQHMEMEIHDRLNSQRTTQAAELGIVYDYESKVKVIFKLKGGRCYKITRSTLRLIPPFQQKSMKAQLSSCSEDNFSCSGLLQFEIVNFKHVQYLQ